MKKLILGSQSPRRKEILGFFKIPFTQVSPDFDEENAPVLSDPSEYAMSLAKGKALSLQSQFPNDIILGADSVVFKDGVYYAKPKDREEAKMFIQTFSGEWQTVVTGMSLVVNGEVFTEASITRVLFNKLSAHAIEQYLNSGIWHDKAGGYSIIGPNSLLVEKIDGCFYNVIGLPINTLRNLLSHADVDLWDHF